MGFVFSDNILHLNAEAFFFSFFKHIFWGVLLKICSCMCTKGLVFYTPPSFVPSGYLNKNKEKKEKKKKNCGGDGGTYTSRRNGAYCVYSSLILRMM